jgi:hypothetical protein
MMKEFLPLATETKLSQEHGQKYVDLYNKGLHETVSKIEASMQAEVKASHEKWRADTKADAEIGGAKLNESVATAGKAIARFATPAFKQLLNESGLGDHPEVIRAFYKVGLLISEDNLGGKATAVTTPKSNSEVLYGPST